MSVQVALVYLCGTACIVCVAAVYLGRVRVRALSKAMASASFVALAALRADIALFYDAAVLCALCLGAAGDLALLGQRRRAIQAGLILFALGHLAYLFAFAQISDATDWLRVPAFVTGIICLSLGIFLAKYAGRLRKAVYVYAALMAGVVAGGYAASMSRGSIVFAAALMFAVSDLAVARQRFVKDSAHNRLVGLPLYYAAQLCLAWNL